MRLVLFGRNRGAAKALESAVRVGCDVVFVVAPSDGAGREYSYPGLGHTARELGIPVGTQEELEALVRSGDPSGRFDLLLSFLYWRKIPEVLRCAAGMGAFNMHPGPLPEFRGARGYNHALLEGTSTFGASLHWMTEKFDEGDLAETVSVPVREDDTALSLYCRTILTSLEMVERFLLDRVAGKPIPRIPQKGEVGWATRAEMVELSRVTEEDDADEIARKARSFWFPPFHGATIELGGGQFTLVDTATLEQLGRYLHGHILDDVGGDI